MKKSPLEGYGKNTEDWSKLIDLWIFNSRYREVLKRRLLDMESEEYVAGQCNISVSQVKRIVENGLQTLLEVVKIEMS
jgi:DNA-directed RNA polymerase specialized sigma subunit